MQVEAQTVEAAKGPRIGQDRPKLSRRNVGTLYYMAPEQIEAKETDEHPEIFSFGAVFCEMVTGKQAFEGDSQASVLASILKDQPPPIANASLACRGPSPAWLRNAWRRSRTIVGSRLGI